MPEFRLQVLDRDPKSAANRKSSVERARDVWNRSSQKESETGKRVGAMITQSDSLAEYDMPAAKETARKAELLSREIDEPWWKRVKR
jgi:hypothetical protein